MRCSRRDEHGPDYYPGEDSWQDREGIRCCSFCGSLHPDDFMEHLENGDVVCPTDKSYKAYIDISNPMAGQIVETGSHSGLAMINGKPAVPDLTEAEIQAGRYRRPIMGVASKTISQKFYFQHLSEAQRDRFVELYNKRQMKIAHPGHFYVLPFFTRRGQRV